MPEIRDWTWPYSRPMKILVLNSGSSSQKTCLFELAILCRNLRPHHCGKEKSSGRATVPILEARNSGGKVHKEEIRARLAL